MYGPPPGYPPPEYPRATSSPPIILLVSGLAALLGFLLGIFVGFGAGSTSETPEPRVTVTIEDTQPPPDQQPTDAPQTGPTQPGATPPGATQPGATQPGATQPGATQPGATQPGATQPGNTQSASPGGTGGNSTTNSAALRMLIVGKDIQPGTYRTAGPTAGFTTCFWARMKGASASPSDVITSGMPTGPETVTIQATDKAFSTGGCAEWIRA